MSAISARLSSVGRSLISSMFDRPTRRRPSTSSDPSRDVTLRTWAPMVFQTTPPQPASNARATMSPLLVIGQLASQNGLGDRIPAMSVNRSTPGTVASAGLTGTIRGPPAPRASTIDRAASLPAWTALTTSAPPLVMSPIAQTFGLAGPSGRRVGHDAVLRARAGRVPPGRSRHPRARPGRRRARPCRAVPRTTSRGRAAGAVARWHPARPGCIDSNATPVTCSSPRISSRRGQPADRHAQPAGQLDRVRIRRAFRDAPPVEQRDLVRPEADRGGCGIERGAATADHTHPAADHADPPADGRLARLAFDRVPDQGQRIDDARLVLTGQVEGHAVSQADGHHDRVMLGQQRGGIDVPADQRAQLEPGAGALHLGHVKGDRLAGQAPGHDAVVAQPAGPLVGLVQRRADPSPAELGRAGQSGRTRTHDGDPEPRLLAGCDEGAVGGCVRLDGVVAGAARSRSADRRHCGRRHPRTAARRDRLRRRWPPAGWPRGWSGHCPRCCRSRSCG